MTILIILMCVQDDVRSWSFHPNIVVFFSSQIPLHGCEGRMDQAVAFFGNDGRENTDHPVLPGAWPPMVADGRESQRWKISERPKTSRLRYMTWAILSIFSDSGVEKRCQLQQPVGLFFGYVADFCFFKDNHG
jgi:hypothetical protein